MTGTTSFTISQRRSGEKMCDDDHHDYHNLMYLMSGNKGGLDSHLVPDEDDCTFNDHHHHQQVAPKVTKTRLFDLNRDLNDDTALAMIMMITDDGNVGAGVDADAEVVVPHDSPSPASKHPPPNEAEPPALVPSLSVCSNHLPCDRGAEEEHSERSLTSTPPKRRTTTKRKRRTKMDKKLRALQGLLPNCNDGVDRASILDEAIVYVKTLQLQLQMMTMPFPMIGIPPPFIAPPLMLPHHHPFPTFPCLQSSARVPAPPNFHNNTSGAVKDISSSLSIIRGQRASQKP